MKNKIKSTSCAIFILLSLTAKVGFAGEISFENWKKTFQNQALMDGITQNTLDKYLPQMTLIPKIIEQDMKKPEYLRNFWDYIEPRLTDEKLAKAKEIHKTYKTWFKKIEEEYQIPAEYLIALWSMETNFGSFVGKTPLLNSLGSLAYHPRRHKFFTKELLAYFHILEDEPYPPVVGSWDGGFGHFQFMPTTFVAYAVDADGNGSKNLTGNIPDALSSAANYLKKMGWRANEPWGREVQLTPDFNWSLIEENKTLREWTKLGVIPIEKIPPNEWFVSATLKAPMGSDGPIFLAYPNYNYLKRWNGLDLYAYTAGLFAEIIKGNTQKPIPPANFHPLKTVDFQNLQQILINKGYYRGMPDGILGPNMRQAIHKYQQDNRLISDGYPNREILTKLNIYQKELKQ